MFPNEIWKLIFGFLPLFDCWKTRVICKRFCLLVNDTFFQQLWGSYFESIPDGLSGYRKLMSKNSIEFGKVFKLLKITKTIADRTWQTNEAVLAKLQNETLYMWSAFSSERWFIPTTSSLSMVCFYRDEKDKTTTLPLKKVPHDRYRMICFYLEKQQYIVTFDAVHKKNGIITFELNIYKFDSVKVKLKLKHSTNIVSKISFIKTYDVYNERFIIVQDPKNWFLVIDMVLNRYKLIKKD